MLTRNFLLCVGLVIPSVCGACLAAGYALAHSQAGADFLLDADSARPADLIYVLGGNLSERAPVAARLFRQHLAPRILLSREPTDASGTGDNLTDVTVRILEQNGVPRDRIAQMSSTSGARSTADEARLLKLYLQVYPAHRILVVTSAFHTRRARMAMNRAVPSADHIFMVAAMGDCSPASWRSSSSCRQETALEWVKLGYYFVTFWG